MNIDGSSQFLQTINIVLEDLECFIKQKNNQHVIYALLKIRKAARTHPNSQTPSVHKKSSASLSHKNYSRKSSLSGHSIGKSAGKQSHASFDIIKAAQIFSQTKKKSIQQKLYTQRYEPQQLYLTRDKQQPTTFSHPTRRTVQPQSRGNTLVPKLEGLVSCEQISDIEQPFTTESRNKQQKDVRNYENSIEEVDDDDDEFQDIVLNRLDVIEQKVNRMLRQKRHSRLSTLSSRNPGPQPYHVSRQRLHNVGSGPEIIYQKQVNKGHLYQYPQSRYPNSTGLMSPRVYIFQNSKNTSMQPSSNKVTNRSFNNNMTDRIMNVTKLVKPQNYFTDNEQYIGDQKVNQQALNNDYLYIEEPGDCDSIIKKNKKLGHYRQSSKTLNQSDVEEPIPRPSQGIHNTLETTIDYAKIKEQTLDSKAFKYIPLSKITPNKTDNVLQKTQRQISYRNQNPRQLNSKYPIQYVNKSHTILVQKSGRKYETSSQVNGQFQYQKNQRGDAYQRKILRQQEAYRSGKNSGIRGKQLSGSGVKAHTENADHVRNQDGLSVASQKNIYSEIRQLRQITKLYGVEREKKHMANYQRQMPSVNHIQSKNSTPHESYDYRYHQKTQGHKYPSSKSNAHQNQYGHQQHLIIQGNYPQERIVRVIRQMPHHPPQVHMVQQKSMIPQKTQYVQYATRQPMIYGKPYGNSQNPVYVIRQRQDPSVYEQVEEVYEEPFYRGQGSSQFRTVTMHNDTNSNISHRKLSSGSINSFKSIPYIRVQGNPPITKERSVDYIVQRPVQYVQRATYKDY